MRDSIKGISCEGAGKNYGFSLLVPQVPESLLGMLAVVNKLFCLYFM